MESKIRLYFESKMRPEHNFIYDDIEEYLDAKSYTSLDINNFQYIKHDLTLTIKINITQKVLNPIASNSIDYCRINNYDPESSYSEKYFYYFVDHKRWLSQNCIELTLLMDDINIFKFQEDFTCDERTLITRQHKSRFLDRQYTFDDSSKALSRNIDLLSENINAPLYKTSESQLNDNEKLNENYILWYRNRDNIDPDSFNQVNPVECWLTFKDTANVTASGRQVVDPSSLSNGIYIISHNKVGDGVVGVDISGTTYYVYGTGSSNEGYLIEIIKSSSNCIINYVRWINVPGSPSSNTYTVEQTHTYALSDTITFDILNNVSLLAQSIPSSTQDDIKCIYAASSTTNTDITYSGSTVSFTVGLEYTDRTDARNIKLINLPYSPTSFSYASSVYTYPSNTWVADSSVHALKLIDLNTEFSRTVSTEITSPFSNLFIQYDYSQNPTEMNRNITYESKLYHSDYYQPKFVYDSFSKIFLLETMNPFGYYNAYRTSHSLNFPQNQKFDFKFHMTRNIVSKFAYSFWLYVQNVKTQDYDNIVCVARNNEEVLYNSQYINYLRTGYNYDLKSKERQEAYGAAGIGLSVAGTYAGVVGSLIAGTFAQNPVLGIAGAVISGITGTISIANASMNYAKSVAQNEQNIQEKLMQAKNQAVSVLNADDVDLLQVYSNNKAKMCIYEVSETMKQALFDMFYYSGYIENKRAIPNVNTRVNFNYLACELFITEDNNINGDIMDDIKEKYKNGVTFFHNSTSNTHFYDYDQVKENWETWLYL